VLAAATGVARVVAASAAAASEAAVMVEVAWVAGSAAVAKGVVV
jgi:hypothetical protein